MTKGICSELPCFNLNVRVHYLEDSYMTWRIFFPIYKGIIE